MSNRQKKERWVRDAVAITDQLIAGAEGRYLCPLCIHWFDDLDDLSLEHAPPQSVGGRHVAVTCRGCNSTSGHTVDAELRRVETLREFAGQRMTTPMKVRIGVGGVEQRGEAIMGPDGLKLLGVPEWNHPQVPDAMIAALGEATATDSPKVTIAFRTPDFRRAAISWLRAGYLVAFATLGYSYILREELAPVRQQILQPESQLVDRFCLMTAPGASNPDRLITFVAEPTELAAVLVSTNDVAVFLPSDAFPGTYRRLATVEPWPPGQRTLSGEAAPWPAKPVYALDRRAIDLAA